MAFDTNEQLWLHRNGVEVNCNNAGDGRYTAILHQRTAGAVRGTTKFTPLDVVHPDTAVGAVQSVCDRNGLLSPWDIQALKRLATMTDYQISQRIDPSVHDAETD